MDSREQRPLSFPGFSTEIVALKTGDYSCISDGIDLREIVAIERKSLSDMLNCIGKDRPRFEHELVRLAKFKFKALVIECAMSELAAGSRYTKLTPKQIMGSLLGWCFRYQVAPIFACDRNYAASVVRVLLHHAARYAKERI